MLLSWTAEKKDTVVDSMGQMAWGCSEHKTSRLKQSTVSWIPSWPSSRRIRGNKAQWEREGVREIHRKSQAREHQRGHETLSSLCSIPSMQLISLPDSVRIQTCSEPAWTVTLVQCWTSVLQMTRGMGLLCSVYGISNQDDFVKSQGWGSHRAGILLTLSVAEIKYWPKTPWERNGFIFTYTLQFITGENQSRNSR